MTIKRPVLVQSKTEFKSILAIQYRACEGGIPKCWCRSNTDVVYLSCWCRLCCTGRDKADVLDKAGVHWWLFMMTLFV